MPWLGELGHSDVVWGHSSPPGPGRRWRVQPYLSQQPLLRRLRQPCQRHAELPSQPPHVSATKRQHRSTPQPRSSFRVATQPLHTLSGVLTRQWQGLQPMSKATAGTTGSRHKVLLQYRAAMRDHQRNILHFLLKPPDELPEAERRCWGSGRSVLALKTLPLAVYKGSYNLTWGHKHSSSRSASPSSPSCSPFQQHPSTSSGEESSFTYACFHILASTLCFHLTRTGLRELHTSGATRPVTTEDIVENKHSAFSARTNVARDADLVNSYTNMLSQETHTTVYAGKCVSFWIKIRDQLIKVILNLFCFSAWHGEGTNEPGSRHLIRDFTFPDFTCPKTPVGTGPGTFAPGPAKAPS